MPRLSILGSSALSELWRHTEQRGYYARLALRELGIEHEDCFGPEEQPFDLHSPHPTRNLKDSTVIYDCVELFSGVGNWSKAHAEAGLRVHPGLEREAKGAAFGDT